MLLSIEEDPMGQISVFGIGNPLLDYVTYAGYDLLKSLGATPGTMNLITREQRRRILSSVSHHRSIPGGSCANTIRGISWLGQASPIDPPMYTGAVGSDPEGKRYIEEMNELGIKTRLRRKQSETGVSFIVVTPDYERTMFTYLGACQLFSERDLDEEQLSTAQFLHITGYMWDTENQKRATLRAMEIAKAQEIRISFDLADPFVVGRYREDFLSWIPASVDILFGNREEISLILNRQGNFRELSQATEVLAPLTIMKVGAEGCLVNDEGCISHIPGRKVQPIDTVGAGDFFAAGFLFGMLQGMGPGECAALANRMAAAIVSVEGCNLRKLNQREILSVD